MSEVERIKEVAIQATLPKEWDESLLPHIQALVQEAGYKIVVLDDDPTGTQTVHDVTVLTEWTQPALEATLLDPAVPVYILTNSRSFSLQQAQQINQAIGTNLKAASQATGRPFRVVSRSDSTLRGHYPGEVQALIDSIGHPVDGILLIPFFQEGRRLTIRNVHYVGEGEWLIPAAQTEYARDASFGYRSSNLREWVVEKHDSGIGIQDVQTITLDDIRHAGPAHVATILQRLCDRQVCVVNAASYADLEVLVAGILEAEANQKHFLYRTAASFVRVRSGLTAPPPLTTEDLGGPYSGGGLIIAGSYIQKSTQQIEHVRNLPHITSVEVSVPDLLDSQKLSAQIERVCRQADNALASGEDVLVYTSRQLVAGNDANASLSIGQAVSAALVEIVQNIRQRLAWIIAKGGITSSDIATKAIGIRRATVLGQAIPGVPVWRTWDESRWPDLVYIVFPGNVGGPAAIADMVQILRGSNNVGHNG